MADVELQLELPVEDAAEADFPDAGALPRTSGVGRASGLDGQQLLQLGVAVGAGSLHVLRTWLLARAERLKHTRVVWNGEVFEAYTAREVERLMRALERRVGTSQRAEETREPTS